MNNRFKPEPWTIDGFASPPAVRTLEGGERFYRAYGGSSPRLGNCFFVPTAGGQLMIGLTPEVLEMELNASLWGNDYEGVVTYEPMGRNSRVSYQIGPVAHDRYAGVDGYQLFQQRAFVQPSGMFEQVKFILTGGIDLRVVLRQVALQPMTSSRYVRNAPKIWH